MTPQEELQRIAEKQADMIFKLEQDLKTADKIIEYIGGCMVFLGGALIWFVVAQIHAGKM